MEKLKIKLLLLEYKKELKENNTKHLNDYVISKLALKINKNDWKHVLDENLYELMVGIFKVPGTHEFEIPSFDEIRTYERKLKNENFFDTDIKKLTAATWIRLMLQHGMVTEKEHIELTDYEINTFITDDRLKKILNFENNNFDFCDYIVDSKSDAKVKKKNVKK